jgi:hypothetical protein
MSDAILPDCSSAICRTATKLTDLGGKVQPLLSYRQHSPLTSWANIVKYVAVLSEACSCVCAFRNICWVCVVFGVRILCGAGGRGLSSRFGLRMEAKTQIWERCLQYETGQWMMCKIKAASVRVLIYHRHKLLNLSSQPCGCLCLLDLWRIQSAGTFCPRSFNPMSLCCVYRASVRTSTPPGTQAQLSRVLM